MRAGRGRPGERRLLKSKRQHRRGGGGGAAAEGACSPVMLQRRRRVGASPEYWLIIPLLAACGTGIVSVMGLWNLRRRGSTVTMGDTATRLPSILATSSAAIGWAFITQEK